MQNKNTNKKLFNKFNNLEQELSDKEIGYTLEKNDIEKISSQNSSQANPLNIIAKNQNRSVLELVASLIGKISIRTFKKSILVSKSIRNNSSKLITSINEKKANAEVQVADVLSNIETEFDKKISEESEIENARLNLIQSYKDRLMNKFQVKNFEANLLIEGQSISFEKIISEDTECLELLKSNLEERQMDHNVFAVTINSKISGERVKHQIDFELQTKGLKWAIFFSKFIMINMKQAVASKNAMITGELLTNATLGREKYIFTYEYIPQLEETKIANLEQSRKSLADLGI